MPAFSRGLPSFLHPQSFRLPSSLRATIFPARQQFVQPRTSARFLSRLCPRKYQYPSYGPSMRSYISSDPVLRTVNQTQKPVLLFKAPNRPWYTFATYALACGSVGLGLWTWKFRSELPTGLPFFVGPAYNVVGFIALCVGLYIFTAPVNKISSLEVIPGMMGGTLQLRIRARIAPMLKERVIYTNIGEVTISEKTAPMVEELVEAERARKQNIREGLEDMFIVSRMWELAARWLHQKWTNFFLSFKFAVLRFGIAKVRVGHDKWKIDCSGYLLEGGKAIDRIISSEE